MLSELEDYSPRSSSSDSEKFNNISSVSEFQVIIPDLQANYFQVPFSSKSWISSISRNFAFNLKQRFRQSLKEFYLNSSSPIFILGQKFESIQPEKRIYKNIKQELTEVIWVTYRCNFHKMIGGKEFTSDSGWGCTLRVGQMLLMNSLKKHFRLSKEECYELIKTIEDNLESAPYSLRNFISLGSEGKRPGDWFTPSAASHAISNLLKIFPIPGFSSIVFMDSLIYKDKLFAAACGLPLEVLRSACVCRVPHNSQCKSTENIDLTWKNSMLLILPLMLGPSKIQKDLYQSFQYFVSHKFSAGVIGGRPKSAIYIIGAKDFEVIVMDPHFVQRASKSIIDLKRNYEKYFNQKFMSIHLKDLESSVCLGLYFRNKEEFFEFEEDLEKHSESVKEIVLIRNETPEYALDDFEVPEANEEGFIVL